MTRKVMNRCDTPSNLYSNKKEKYISNNSYKLLIAQNMFIESVFCRQLASDNKSTKHVANLRLVYDTYVALGSGLGSE